MSKRAGGIYYPSVQIPTTVTVDGDYLRWDDKKPDGQEAQWRRPTDRTLVEFSKLHSAPPESICDFARRYGVLRAFKVARKDRQDILPTDIEMPDGSVWVASNYAGGTAKEPIELWRYLSSKIGAILRINSYLKGRSRTPKPSPGLEEDWKILDGGDSTAPPLEDPRDAQFFLLHVINDWLRTGSVGLELSIANWSTRKTDWKLEITYSGLLGALAYRLLLTVVGESNLYACDGCGNPYIRTKRAPRPGQENFCDDCTEIAKRRASQRWKEKNR